MNRSSLQKSSRAVNIRLNRICTVKANSFKHNSTIGSASKEAKFGWERRQVMRNKCSANSRMFFEFYLKPNQDRAANAFYLELACLLKQNRIQFSVHLFESSSEEFSLTD